jgi:hypothetical protein
VPWLVRRLAAAISSRLIVHDPGSLSDILASAIKETCDTHSATCDLANPDSPSTTVAIIRLLGDSLDYLTLGDSPIVFWHRDDSFTPIADYRLSQLPGARPYTIELVRAHRNKENGFWVASTDPRAAYRAVTGSAPTADLAEIGLFTDGITRLIDWYGFTWPAIFACLRSDGPDGLIRIVRRAERENPRPHGKVHDDATSIYLRQVRHSAEIAS